MTLQYGALKFQHKYSVSGVFVNYFPCSNVDLHHSSTCSCVCSRVHSNKRKDSLKYKLLDKAKPYYKYVPPPFLENESYKLYSDQPILSDKPAVKQQGTLCWRGHMSGISFNVRYIFSPIFH